MGRKNPDTVFIKESRKGVVRKLAGQVNRKQKKDTGILCAKRNRRERRVSQNRNPGVYRRRNVYLSVRAAFTHASLPYSFPWGRMQMFSLMDMASRALS